MRKAENFFNLWKRALKLLVKYQIDPKLVYNCVDENLINMG